MGIKCKEMHIFDRLRRLRAENSVRKDCRNALGTDWNLPDLHVYCIHNHHNGGIDLVNGANARDHRSRYRRNKWFTRTTPCASRRRNAHR